MTNMRYVYSLSFASLRLQFYCGSHFMMLERLASAREGLEEPMGLYSLSLIGLKIKVFGAAGGFLSR